MKNETVFTDLICSNCGDNHFKQIPLVTLDGFESGWLICTNCFMRRYDRPIEKSYA